jgi:hypothetical protein
MLRNLRDFGFGKSSMEEVLLDEASKLCQLLEKRSCDGSAICLPGSFNVSIVNALWTIVTGEKLDLEDPTLDKVVASMNQGRML